MDTQTEIVRIPDLLAAQRAAHRASGQASAEERKARIQQAIDLLVKHSDALAQAMATDFGGRPLGYSLMNDVLGSLTALKDARDHVDEWLAPDERAMYAPYDQLGATARVLHQAKGSIGIIGTWNAPLFTLFSPLAGALAAGNRAVLKPSEVVPATAEVLAAAVAEAFDPAVVAVVTGGPEVADALTSQPFDHFVFTGSTRVGKLVMANAAQNLVPLTLELGGKSPTILSRSADLADAAHKIAVGKATNGGQICISPDTVHVAREQVEDFLAALRAAYTALHPTVAGNDDVVAVVNDAHAQRIDGYVADAEARGARVLSAPEEPVSGDERRRPLRIVVDPPAEATIRQEEIFGPAVVVLGYDDIAEVIESVNDGPRPLALYWFGTDAAEQQVVLDRTLSGGVTINDVMAHGGLNDAPFGGVGASGMGHYNGREGFLEFSHARSVYSAAGPDLRGEWGMLPPYSESFAAMMAAQVTA